MVPSFIYDLPLTAFGDARLEARCCYRQMSVIRLCDLIARPNGDKLLLKDVLRHLRCRYCLKAAPRTVILHEDPHLSRREIKVDAWQLVLIEYGQLQMTKRPLRLNRQPPPLPTPKFKR